LFLWRRPGAGKSYQALKLMAGGSGGSKHQGSCTVVHPGAAVGAAEQIKQQQQRRSFLLLSPETVMRQMKVGATIISTHLPH